MSAARTNFLRRHSAQLIAAGDPAVQGSGLAASPTNEAARSLRCGLMVQAYASLETFLRERVAESMSFVAAGTTSFTSLPSRLQEMSIFGALEGLRFRVNMWGTTDPRSRQLVQGEAETIASTARTPYGFSAMMFGFDRSNLSPANLKEFLEVIGVGGDPWHHLTALASRVGLGGLPLRDGVVNGYQRRNASAHDADSQVTPQQIEDFLRDSLATALGFDAFLSRAARLLHEGNKVDLGGRVKLLETDIRLRFIDPHAAGWRELKEGRRQAAAIHRSGQPDMSACVARARVEHEVVVTRDARQWPVNWTTTDCP